LLGSGKGWEKLRHDAETGERLGIDVRLWTPEQAKRRVPVLRDTEFEGAVWCATDGVVDIHALLSGYLKAATGGGARVRYGSALEAVHQRDDGFELRASGETITAKILIDAAGAWANTVAVMAGAAALPLRPCRRHLFVSPPIEWVDKNWPFVWDVSHDIYFRPEGNGLLLCACDQEEMSACDPAVDPSTEELLAEKIQHYMPALSNIAINKKWAGLRTLSSDGRFVIGWDAKVRNFFWVAGLGGHGMTTSSAVGALAAELIAAGPGEHSDAFSPERFMH
jgi:D-arginine dehydrogenase